MSKNAMHNDDDEESESDYQEDEFEKQNQMAHNQMQVSDQVASGNVDGSYGDDEDDEDDYEDYEGDDDEVKRRLSIDSDYNAPDDEFE